MKNYLKNNWKNIVLKCVVIALIIAVDMITKVYFAKHPQTIPFIKGFISFKYVENTGAAFGIFGKYTIMLSVISILFIGVFTYWDICNKDKNFLSHLGYAFIVAGAVGNLIDRVFLGYVRDFINFDFMTWGIFNIADTFITLGCVVYVIYVVTFYVKLKRANRDTKSK